MTRSKILKKIGGTYVVLASTTTPYKVEASQDIPVLAWGVKESGSGTNSTLISNLTTTAFSELEDYVAGTTVVDMRVCTSLNPNVASDLSQNRYSLTAFCTSGEPGYSYIYADKFIEDSTDTVFYSFVMLMTNEEIISKIETTNFQGGYPYILYTTSGANPKFFQKDGGELWSDWAANSFVERSAGLPNSEITIIRVDDLV